jgi:hypothetical protein
MGNVDDDFIVTEGGESRLPSYISMRIMCGHL